MPGEPPDPGINQEFIDTITTGTWSGDGVISSTTGVQLFPAVSPSTAWPTDGEWALEPTGLKLSQEVHAAVCNGTANDDGTFTDVAGNKFRAHNCDGCLVLVAA